MKTEYKYVGRNLEGIRVEGTIWVQDEFLGLQKLNNRGISIISFTKSESDKQRSQKTWTQKEIAQFFYQLHVLLKSGFSLVDTVQFISNNTKNKKVAKWARQISEDLRTGDSLYEALKKAKLPEMVLQWIYISEQSSNLTESCKEINEYYNSVLNLNKRIKKIVGYPLFLILLAVVLFIMVTMYFLPQFFPLYKGFGIEPPGFVVFLVGCGLFLQMYGLYLLLGTLISVLLFMVNRKKLEGSLENILVKIPFVKHSRNLRFFLLLSVMLKGGIDLYQSIQFIGKTTKSTLEQEKFLGWANSIKKGIPLSEVLIQGGFTSMYIEMVKVGENSGRLVEMISKAVEQGNTEIQENIEKSLGFLQPILIFFVGLLIGSIVYSILLPISEVIKGL